MNFVLVAVFRVEERLNPYQVVIRECSGSLLVFYFDEALRNFCAFSKYRNSARLPRIPSKNAVSPRPAERARNHTHHSKRSDFAAFCGQDSLHWFSPSIRAT
jgi:hypothetical protein